MQDALSLAERRMFPSWNNGKDKHDLLSMQYSMLKQISKFFRELSTSSRWGMLQADTDLLTWKAAGRLLQLTERAVASAAVQLHQHGSHR